MSARLSGRTALVFGAGSSGEAMSNGRAAALAYARAGAAVAAVDINLDSAQRTAKEIHDEGGAAVALAADVTDEDDIIAAVAAVTAELGSPDILHNNVGVAEIGAITTLDRAQWDQAIALNVTGVFLACKHVLPTMIRAGQGAVINVSSVASIRHTGYDYPAYMTAKAGVNQLTISLALTYARQGIRVNAILPGLIDTPLVDNQLVADPAARAERDRASPTGRMGSPWDIAHAAVFLASSEASYINGVCLPVDGGLTASTGGIS